MFARRPDPAGAYLQEHSAGLTQRIVVDLPIDEHCNVVVDRYRRARQYELPGEAITILKAMKGDELVKEFQAGVTQTLLELVGLELYSGRLEDAATDLAELKEVFEDLTRPADPPTI